MALLKPVGVGRALLQTASSRTASVEAVQKQIAGS